MIAADVPVYEVRGAEFVALAILLLSIGAFIVHRVGFLNRQNIPPAVIGGLVCSVVVAALAGLGIVEATFDMSLRDLLLLFFFSTVGLNARVKSLLRGGRVLVLLVAACSAFLVVQNVLASLVAFGFGREPAFGLFGGSISLAGGHGTAVAWGNFAVKEGLAGASEFGIACATLGLILGGLLGSPIAGRLIARHGLEGKSSPDILPDPEGGEGTSIPNQCLTVRDFMATLFALALCIGVGEIVNDHLFEKYRVLLPGFLTAMVVGVAIANTIDPLRLHLRHGAIEIVSGLSLRLFLTMSLASMNLLALLDSAFLLVVVIALQAVAVTYFATRVVFRLMGRDYDAAVITAGFLGLMLGATPVAMANMDAVSSRHGHSTKALLVVPIVGAFFLDLINNAAVLPGILSLPFF